MNASSLTRRIKDRALSLGFTTVGVAPVESSPHRQFLLRWLAEGYHGKMAYLARDPVRRSDPRRILPGARSAVCVTLDYFPLSGSDVPEESGVVPHISVYARNEDYHEVMGPKLRMLLESIRADAGAAVDGKAYVDTGPVLERELAASAGLGWVGKNTQLLDQRGSWFFLGEILVDVELVPDSPVTDLCGSCTACIDACPTDALRAGYVLDSRRCISYLNIELRGAIPPQRRADLDEHLYGCDICQQVCPWNGKAPTARRPEFVPRSALQTLRLADLLGMDQATYARIFRRSPMKRARRPGLARNAAVVLGNRGDREAIGPLARSLRSEADPMVRGHAAWALGRVGGSRARRELDRARRADDDPGVRREAEAALERDGAPGTRVARTPGSGGRRPARGSG